MPVIFTKNGALIGAGADGVGAFIAVLHAGASMTQEELRKQWRVSDAELGHRMRSSGNTARHVNFRDTDRECEYNPKVAP